MATHRWKDVKKKVFTPAQIAKLDREVAAEVMKMKLSELRKLAGMTQAEVAVKLKSTQAQTSVYEKSDVDHKVSTLRRYVRAVGGDMKVVATVNGKTIELAI